MNCKFYSYLCCEVLIVCKNKSKTMMSTKQNSRAPRSIISESTESIGKQCATIDAEIQQEAELRMSFIVKQTNIRQDTMDYMHIRHAIALAMDHIKNKTVTKILNSNGAI